ncbi:hypothetical protein [Crassaminicella profunda]|uniref:hypothetical protein n=1 Tax=Crassaminicella profunda TaxID=1286698 RepID=UPI001CA62E07|nr:hypothetical protein [Crassaminicella profunda]QZY55683.1 hypothetical protein K7H06_01310 [Crassaminicella profunda]
MKKISIFLSVLIFVTCFSIVGQAQTFHMDLTVKTGFDGKCKLGGMNPVKVLLTTKTDVFKGVLKVVIGERVYTHPINLERNTKKEYTFSIPVLKGNEEIEVSLEKMGETIESKNISLEVFPENTIFIGILSEQPQNYYGIKTMNNDLFQDKNIESIKLNETMDYSLKELENFNVLLIDNFSTENLSSKNQGILKKWIANGNTVVIGANQYDYKNLTGIFEGIVEKQNIGDGWVIPVKTFDDIESISDKINENITAFSMNKIVNTNVLEKKINDSKNLYGAVDHLLKPTYNTVFFLLSFLIIYLLLLGMFMYFGKRQWIFPTIIISFCFIFYGFSFIGGFANCKAVSAAVKINHYGLEGYRFTSLYPNQKGDSSLAFTNDEFIDVCNSTDYILDPIHKKVTDLVNQEDYDQLEGDEPHSLYREEVQFGETHTMRIHLNEEMLEGEIINPMVDKMYNCFLLIGDTVISLGDLDGKEKKSINYEIDNSLRTLGDYNYLEKIYEIANLEDYQKQMFEYYFYQLDQSSYNAHFFGFSKDIEKINIDNHKEKTKEISLNVFDVKINNTEKVYLPCEVIRPVMNYEENEEKRECIVEEGKEITIYYAIPKNINIEAINLYTKVDGGEITLEVYNQDTKVWEILTSEKLMKNQLGKYISKGPLMIKIKGDGRIILPQIDVKGTNGEVGDENA